MFAFAWFILLAASAGGELVDDVYQIPASSWRYVEVGLRPLPGTVSAHYEVVAGSPEVRMAFMRREDEELLREDLPHGQLAVTPVGRTGHFSDRMQRQGDYVVVLENRDSKKPATVHLRVWLESATPYAPAVTRLSAQRQVTVVAVSLAVFFAVVLYSGRRLLRAVRR